MTPFKPPPNWEDLYASKKEYHFGEEPSQIARTALSFYRLFDGPAEGLALDLGSGEGRDTAFLAQAGLRVVARDISPTGLKKTRSLLARRGISPENVDLALGDVNEFDYPPETYDLALAVNVFQFLPPEDVPSHIAKLQAATKIGGICAIGVFSPAMISWGAEIDGNFSATADQMLAYFSREAGWQPLDRTEYWTYRPDREMMASFAYVVARKLP